LPVASEGMGRDR